MTARVHMIVEGLVQGVGFRWYAARRAEGLGVAGSVRNLANGSVEIEAEAERSLLEEYISMMKVGPQSAHVTNIRLTWEQPRNEPGGFRIR